MQCISAETVFVPTAGKLILSYFAPLEDMSDSIHYKKIQKNNNNNKNKSIETWKTKW